MESVSEDGFETILGPKEWELRALGARVCPKCTAEVRCPGSSFTNCHQHVARKHPDLQYNPDTAVNLRNALVAAKKRLASERPDKGTVLRKKTSFHQKEETQK